MKLAQYRWHVVGLAASVLMALLGWALASVLGVAVPPGDGVAVPTAGASAPRVAASASGTMPGAPARAVASVGDKVGRLPSDLRIWEAAPSAAPSTVGKVKALTPDFWKISGVYETVEGRRAIVEYGPPRGSEYLKVGDALPNGARILAVDKKSVTVKARVANQWKTIVLDF